MQELIERRRMIQGLGKERRAIREAAREFTVTHVLPTTGELGPAKDQIARERINEIAGMAQFGILIPEEYCDLDLGAFEHWIFRGTSENSDASHLRCATRQGESVMSDRTGARHGDCHG